MNQKRAIFFYNKLFLKMTELCSFMLNNVHNVSSFSARKLKCPGSARAEKLQLELARAEKFQLELITSN